jgi:hypothetical protein
MKRKIIGTFFSLLSATLIAGSASAANIAWVSFHATDLASANAAGVLGVGANAPDKGYTDFLTANGHTVTRVLTADGNAALATVLNAFDLVIVGRSVNSGHYELDAETNAWNSLVTKPTIIMGGYTLRNNRLGYTTGTTMPDAGGATNPTGVVRLQVNNPAHPIFAGIALDGTNTMVNPYNTALPTVGVAPATPLLQRGISVNSDPITAGGTVLATINTAGDGANGGMIISKWAPGTVMNNNPAAPMDVLGGHRLVFLSGTREANTHSSETAGFYDLDADGARMFLNAVNFMAAIPEPATPTLAAFALAGLGMFRRRAR